MSATAASRLPPFIAEIASRARTQFIPRGLAEPRMKKHPPRLHRYIKGVYKGNYFRYRIPDKKKNSTLKVPALPTPTTGAPKPFTTPTPQPPSPQRLHPPTFKDHFKAWWIQNWATLVLNAGSVCTLLAFTRSDVLELRSLSMVGSLSFVAFQLTQLPRRWTPILWSSLFAAVNGIKIAQILHERNATVVLNETEQQVYQEFFLPHGMTPKQFEIVMKSAKPMVFPKHRILVRQGSTVDGVYLIVKGATHAHILGRHLTAASSVPQNRDNKKGGDSGAWIGEMAFLEWYWQKEQNKKKAAAGVIEKNDDENNHENNENKRHDQESKPWITSKTKANTITNAATTTTNTTTAGLDPSDTLSKAVTKTQSSSSSGPRMMQAMYTIQALDEEVHVLKWNLEDMEALMGRSTDMRGALTRAMTAAIVGKVINFTVSRKTGAAVPTWSQWLDDFRSKGTSSTGSITNNNTATHHVRTTVNYLLKPQDDDEDDDDEEEQEEANAKAQELAAAKADLATAAVQR